MRAIDLHLTLHQFGVAVLMIPLIALSVVALAAMVLDLLRGD